MVVGLADPTGYLTGGIGYLGAVVGRYANRIAGARFVVDGVTHRVSANEGETCLHGGAEGFDQRPWTVEEVTADTLTLSLVSPDGDQGFPGEVTARATYTATEDGFALDLSAETTAATPVCLSSHLYLNLAGEGSTDDHLLTVLADRYAPIDADSIPLGILAEVAGTPFDLRHPTQVGPLVRTPHPQLDVPLGVDHSFAPTGSGVRPVARLAHPGSGRTMELLSDQPALQVYTGNFLDGTMRGRSGRLRQGDGIALEPQVHPDSPNHDWGVSPVLAPGRRWTSSIRWRFGW